MTTSAEERFAELAERFADRPGVTPPAESGRGFGAGALKVDGSICAMLHQDHLVLKLPAARVTALIDGHGCLPFDAGKGRPMKEWVMVPAEQAHTWAALADEAVTFVGRR